MGYLEIIVFAASSEDELIGNSYQHFFSMVEQNDDFSFKAHRRSNNVYFWCPSFYSNDIYALYDQNEYVNIAITRGGDIATIYINGIEIGTQTGWESTYDELQPIRFGWGAENEWSYAYQKEVSFWNKNLSQQEILSNMDDALNGDEPGLIGYWPLNEGNGSTAHDYSVNSNHGTIYNAIWEDSPSDF